MTSRCSGVILAGGQSLRFSGKNKALIQIGNQTILARIYKLFQEFFDEIILVTNQPLCYLNYDMVITRDLFSMRSSMTGIHAGLFTATRPYAFFSACDTPFLKKEVIQAVLDKIENPFDVIMPQTSAGMEPLCAAYSKRCLKQIAQHIQEKKFKITKCCENFCVKKIPESVLRKNDSDLISFFNINTQNDLNLAEKINRSL